MKNTTVEEIEAIMKEAEDVEINVRDSECVFVPKTWLYFKLTTLTQHHQDQLAEVYREIEKYCDEQITHQQMLGGQNSNKSVIEAYEQVKDFTRGIDISDKTTDHE